VRRPSDSLRSREGVESLIGELVKDMARKDEIPFSNLNDEPNPEDMNPEESVTKQFWKTKYWGRKQLSAF